MTKLNELPNKAEVIATDNFLTSDTQNNDAKVSAEQLKNYIAPEATQTNAGVVTTGTQQFAGDKTLNGSLDVTNGVNVGEGLSVGGALEVGGEITKGGQPFVPDVVISQQAGNAIQQKTDGIFAQAVIIDDTDTTPDKVWSSEKTAAELGVDRVIENGQNANGFFRKWESGLIEQWGETSGGGRDSTINLSFPVAFKSLPVVIATPYIINNSKLAYISVSRLTVSDCDLHAFGYNTSTTIDKCFWSAKGYWK